MSVDEENHTDLAMTGQTVSLVNLELESVCVCVHPLREVSGNNLTPRNKRLYLWPLSNRG